MPVNQSSSTPQISRAKARVFVPPRREVPVPGARSPFGSGFFRRLRKSKEAGYLLVFMAVAAPIFLLGLAGSIGPFKEGLRTNTHPGFFMAALVCGAAFFLVPLRMLYENLDGVARGDRKGSRTEPWTWEYPWSTEWMKPDYTGGRGSTTILGRVALLAVIGLFNFGWATDSWVFKGILIVMDLFALLVVYDSLRKLVQWLRFRHSVVIWSEIPVFPGERLEGRIAFSRTMRVSGPPRVTLRCMADEWVKIEGQERQRQLLPFALYQETHAIPVPESGALDALDISFKIPRNLPGTDLAAEEATYWQIAIDVPMAGPDLEEVFLAPIYDRVRRT